MFAMATVAVPTIMVWLPPIILCTGKLTKTCGLGGVCNTHSNELNTLIKYVCSAEVWLLKYVASLITSLNQNDIEVIINSNAIYRKSCE